MAETLINEEDWKEIDGWLRDLWCDGNFVIPPYHFKRADFAGAYTRMCCLVRREGEEYLLKLYNSQTKGRWGGWTEMEHYGVNDYVRHGLFPRLIASLPRWAPEKNETFQAILISYYPYEFPVPSSLLDVAACMLNLATLFRHFSRDGRIYFDLKPEHLRLDGHGSLHLIDFTDLLTAEQLAMRKMGLPVPDHDFCPPEGREYQQIYLAFKRGEASFKSLWMASTALKPDAYQSFNLGRLALFLLDGREPNDEVVRAHVAAAASPAEGAFTPDEQRTFLTLLEKMLTPTSDGRASLEDVRRTLWPLLEPRLIDGDGAVAGSVGSSRRLLSTLTEDFDDELSREIHQKLGRFWR